MEKPKTYFIDIDGCLFQHYGEGPSNQWFSEPSLLGGAKNFLDTLESKGHYIVLVTARKEKYRQELERMLRSKELIYDQLIMGITSGERVIINDSKSGNTSCSAITVTRNEGLKKCLAELS